MDMPTGLSQAEAKKILLESGPNQIFEAEKISFFGIARHEVTEPMILLLLFVGIIYSIWGNLGDAITIFAVILALVFAEVAPRKRLALWAKSPRPRQKCGAMGGFWRLIRPQWSSAIS